jgi:hypothetical protein
MSHDQDLEAPTIFVEAPPEDEQDLLEGAYLNSVFQNEQHPEVQALFRQMFPDTPSSSRAPGVTPELFSFESPQQISPLVTAGLREGSAGNIFLAPTDQTSPVDPSWSPVSTSEGDGRGAASLSIAPRLITDSSLFRQLERCFIKLESLYSLVFPFIAFSFSAEHLIQQHYLIGRQHSACSPPATKQLLYWLFGFANRSEHKGTFCIFHRFDIPIPR